MKITWLGHSGFRIEIADQVLLVDPWFSGNPVFDAANRDEAIKGVTACLVSHGHFDHASDAFAIGVETGCKVLGIFDLVSYMAEQQAFDGVGFNKGGTVTLGDVKVTMVSATHSSSMMVDGKPLYAGSESGFVIAGEGQVIYFAGDTDVHADMGLIAEMHRPTVGILPIGGHFTMDAERAAFACRKFFDFEAIIPCHYKTFPLLAQSADALTEAVAPTPVHALDVMGSVEI